ncbi:disulfide oxidoreductase [Sutcliffiella horikoshii]|uniref:disulfide oxidoreductase n=1 Tax=Sutcliffiella horikoshii TaxID=79883 RepID=UPI001CBF546C|nr:disulfide oxidoreductase [Sutcliffiella horikoshii]UAL48411.1 disulfide bond formation protein B [Sutcliffiella horikoshii]
MDHSKKIENLLLAAAIIALVASLGSLYFSEVLLYIPCELCWYQRILMYPLVILLGIAAVKKDAGIATYVLPLSIIGGSISIYHYLIQKIAFLGENSVSCGVVPCTGQYINWLGFITIPFLALIGFTSITVILFYVKKLSKKAGN